MVRYPMGPTNACHAPSEARCGRDGAAFAYMAVFGDSSCSSFVLSVRATAEDFPPWHLVDFQAPSSPTSGVMFTSHDSLMIASE